MDRNFIIKSISYLGCVALRKESVDRNMAYSWLFAWIAVALRKESVDRNITCKLNFCLCLKSLSARRAWIEMEATGGAGLPLTGRSPQGERG